VALLLSVIAIIAALYLRLPELEKRPMHTDEAVHAIKLGTLIEEDTFEYDPTEYHGPTLPYSGLILARLAGKNSLTEISKTTLRAVAVTYGIGLLLLLPLIGDGIGRVPLAFAALFTAVSPIMVYFSRYYIMEMPFVFFTFGLIACGWRYFMTRKMRWAIASGIFAGLVHATKETCLITFFALATALFFTALTDYFRRGSGLGVINRNRKPPVESHHLIIGFLVALAVSVSFFSSFFTHWQGPLDSILTYKSYLARSGGSGHEHPFYYYFTLLSWRHTGGRIWSELTISLLAAAGGFAAFSLPPDRHRNVHLVRFLTLYAAVTFIIYSSIPYKTPWSIMSFHHAAILLAGYGSFHLFRSIGPKFFRALFFLLVAWGTYDLFSQARQGSFRFPADIRNPYVYSHTSTNFEKLVTRIRAFQKLSDTLEIQVAHIEFAWPMHWYLRDLNRVAYRDQITPEIRSGDVTIVASSDHESARLLLGDDYVSDGPYGLRPDALLSVFVRKTLWDEFLRNQSPPQSR